MHFAHQAWSEHRRVYGARRLTAEIRSRGHAWNRKRVARLMQEGGIEGIHRRRRGKYGRWTASTATADDLVERNFTAPVPDQLWVADITYLRTWEGHLYLAVVVDACSRRVVAGQWPTTCAPNWSSTRSGWRCSPAGLRPAWCITPTAAAGTPPTTSARRCGPPGCWPR